MAKRLHLIIWVCCCFLAQPHLSGQNQLLDSLLHLVEQGQPDTLQARYLARISAYYLRRDLDKALEYADQTLVVARQTGQQHLVGKALINKCIAYQDKGVFDSVQLIASQAELHFQRHPNVIELSNLYSTRGHLERRLGRNDKAFDWYIKAVKNLEENFEDSTDFNAMPAYLNNVAISLNGKGAYKEAFTYLEQALAMAEQQEAKLSICVLLSVMGKNLVARGEYENALDHYLRSLKLKDEIDDQVGKIYLLANISRLYIETERYREAEQHLTQALALVNALGYTGARANVMSTMAYLYHSKGDHAKAIKWGQETIDFSKKDKNLEILTDIYDIMASSYAAIDKPEEAYEYRTLYAIERDSFHQQQQQENVEQLRLAYEVEKTEKENNALKRQAEKDQIMLRQQNLMMIGAVLGLLLLALVIGLIYRDLKRKQQYSHELEATVAQRTAELQRANEDLEQVNYELTGFTYIASHDIKEPIRVINSYVGLIQSRLPEQVGMKLKDYFEIIRASGQQLYTLIEDFMQYSSLSREDSSQADEIELPLLVENLIKGLDVSEKASVKYEGAELVCLNQSMLFLILKNLVENGLKYNQSEHPEILISGKKSAGQIEFRVKDNGIGIPAAFQDKIFETFKRLHSREEYLGTGLGLSIVKLAVSKLDGEISLESEEGKGSTFIITCAEAAVSDAHV